LIAYQLVDGARKSEDIEKSLPSFGAGNRILACIAEADQSGKNRRAYGSSKLKRSLTTNNCSTWRSFVCRISSARFGRPRILSNLFYVTAL